MKPSSLMKPYEALLKPLLAFALLSISSLSHNNGTD
jgi:hypothetical protein